MTTPQHEVLPGDPRDPYGRAHVAHVLYMAGLSTRDIATRLGLAPSTIRGYLDPHDPTGRHRKQRERQARRRLCSACGIHPTLTADGVCQSCARTWTPHACIAALTDWYSRYGFWPQASDLEGSICRRDQGPRLERWNARRWPSAATLRRLFGSVPAAVHAASLATTKAPWPAPGGP